jgi:hypothetical protein
VITDLFYFPGTPLSGPGKLFESHGDARTALKIELRLAAMQDPPEEALEFLEAHARLVASSRGMKPIRATAVLTRGSRVFYPGDAESFIARLEAGAFGASAQVSILSGVLPRGVTAVFRARSIDLEIHPLLGEPMPDRVEIQVHRSSDGGEGEMVDVTLVLEDLITPEEEETFGDWEDERFAEEAGLALEPPVDMPVFSREFVLLDSLAVSGAGCVALFITSPFDGAARMLAAVIRVTPAPEGTSVKWAAHAEAFARCQSLLERPIAGTGDRRRAVLDEKLPWPSIEEAAASLADNARPRAALVYLAGATGARFAEDLVLSAPDELVTALAESVMERLKREEVHTRGALGWVLEKTALLRMVEFLETQEIAPGLSGLLSAYAGEVSRHASILEEILDSSSGLAELESFLVDGNAYFLEDTSPASRTRAYDWLALRRKAPSGYDPLAPLKERMEALAGYFETIAGTGGEDGPP